MRTTACSPFHHLIRNFPDSAKDSSIEETKGQAHEKGVVEQLQEKKAVLTREEEARLEVVWGIPSKPTSSVVAAHTPKVSSNPQVLKESHEVLCREVRANPGRGAVKGTPPTRKKGGRPAPPRGHPPRSL